MMSLQPSPVAIDQRSAAKELLRRRKARTNLADFTLYTKPDYVRIWPLLADSASHQPFETEQTMNEKEQQLIEQHNETADNLWFGDYRGIGFREEVKLQYPYRALINKAHKKEGYLPINEVLPLIGYGQKTEEAGGSDAS